MIQNRKFTNLTKAQTEALLECFGYFVDGWVEHKFICISRVWIIWLKHQRNQRDMQIFIYPHRYRVRVDHMTKKVREFKPDGNRYQLVVNSDSTVSVVQLKASVSMM